MKHPSKLQQRKRAGLWLRELRVEAELTQLELARRLRLKYYAFISQVETGFARLPTEKMEDWARALDADPAQFARQLLSLYEPEWYRLLYDAKTRPAGRNRRLQSEKSRRRNSVATKT